MKNVRYVLWALVALAFIGFIILNLPKKEVAEVSEIMPVAGFNQGSHFTLTDQNGDIFNSEVEIAEGEYALIFFGFTHCPVICPTELQKMAVVLDALPDDIAGRITPIFITVDPERDTVGAMQAYVPLFHDRIIGLTGDVETVHNVLNDWKVFYTKVDDPQFTEYTMDHSTYAYLADHNMQIVAIYRMKNTADQIVDNIQNIVR
jgi:protein SCO1/2